MARALLDIGNDLGEPCVKSAALARREPSVFNGAQQRMREPQSRPGDDEQAVGDQTIDAFRIAAERTLDEVLRRLCERCGDDDCFFRCGRKTRQSLADERRERLGHLECFAVTHVPRKLERVERIPSGHSMQFLHCRA